MREADGATRFLFAPLVYAWVSPTTAVGLAFGILSLFSGAHVRRSRGTMQFYGGAIGRCFNHVPMDPLAVALGHVIIARDADALDLTEEHELVHVRQAELFGPLFLPAYAAASLLAWMKGGHAYWDNWFERDARGSCRDRL